MKSSALIVCTDDIRRGVWHVPAGAPSQWAVAFQPDGPDIVEEVDPHSRNPIQSSVLQYYFRLQYFSGHRSSSLIDDHRCHRGGRFIVPFPHTANIIHSAAFQIWCGSQLLSNKGSLRESSWMIDELRAGVISTAEKSLGYVIASHLLSRPAR